MRLENQRVEREKKEDAALLKKKQSRQKLKVSILDLCESVARDGLIRGPLLQEEEVGS